MVWHEEEKIKTSSWNFTYLFIIMIVLFVWLAVALVGLQIVEGGEYSQTSAANSVVLSYKYPNRGVILDRNGEILAENVAANNLYLVLDDYYTKEGVDKEKVSEAAEQIVAVIGDQWRTQIEDQDTESLAAWLVDQMQKSLDKREEDMTVELLSEVLISEDVDNETTIKLKSLSDTVEGLAVREGSKRNYPGGHEFTHILGYTSIVTAEDLDELDYLDYDEFVARNGYNDIVGRLGVEKVYDEQLIGERGLIALEIDGYGNVVTDTSHELQPVNSGKNLYLTIDSKAQKKMVEVIDAGVEKYNATGGAGIIQDIKTGELLVLSTFPTYDNNQFIGGISQADYDKLLNDKRLPLLDRPIGAQFPPGSTFKTIAAAAALDAGVIDLDTIYVSRTGYTFSNGAPFQEYRNNSYGSLNIIDAIARSSNIFFCETIRDWSINELVPYYEKFGIGDYTGVDLYGEQPGRLPSPAHKKELANTPGVTWLDEIWYPEGDSCNTVIGQGIGLVTPLQMSNWIAAIANGGTLTTPHVGMKFKDADGSEEMLEFKPIRADFISDEALETTRYAMRQAVAGPKKSISALTDAKVAVAAKTGTAEFGAINSKGQYEHAHGWVTGFFPYDDPKYAFVILLEDGGESFYAAQMAREYIDWMVSEGY
ncbi:MAG: penicillin-binding transpeptidase domain-containing protein [Candidatus Dojkabacteria bacterium]|nr:MAG: penicillin-binding transpeptidase domain-containing protein [Candidatus Dojkabacteria bacterium]